MLDRLDESTLPVSVDLLRYNAIESDGLRAHIDRDGVALWKK
jgi:hypothetical protein